MSWEDLLTDPALKVHLPMQDNAANNDVMNVVVPEAYDLVESSSPVDTSTRSQLSGASEPFAAWYPRYLQKAANFDKIQNPSSGAFANGQLGFTVCGWNKTPQDNTTAVLLFGHMANSGSTNRSFSVYADNGAAADGARLVFFVQSTDGASTRKSYTTNDRVFLGGGWVHWAMVYHSTDGLSIYIDGAPYTNLTKSTDLAAQAPYTNSARFTAGGQFFGSDTNWAGTGFCDYRAYTRPLADAEIATIYTGPTASSDNNALIQPAAVSSFKPSFKSLGL